MTGREAAQGGRRRRSALQHLVARINDRYRCLESARNPSRFPRASPSRCVDGAVEVQGPKGKLRQAHSGRHQLRAGRRQPAGERARRPSPQLAQVPRPGAEPRRPTRSRGVTEGFKKELDIVGVGYRAEVKGKQVIFALGYSHAVVFDIPTGIDIAIDKQTHITVTGVDRQLVGQVAANIRRLRKPDPYKQKGVRYTGEVLKKKAGKTGAK